jgi:VWFA-related protein
MRASSLLRTLSLSALVALGALAALHAQAPAAPKPPDTQAPAASKPPDGQPPAAPQKPPAAQTPAPANPRDIIRRTFDIITTDVIVRDNNNQFIADLKKDEFEVYEDGVKQEVVTFVLTHGGRTYNQTLPPPPPPMEGIILPPAKPTNDAAGRIFLIYVDDLHLDFRNTGRIRDLFKKISKELIHEGDMFGILSSGPSSIAIDLTYDHKRLDEALNKISGGGLKPSEILEAPEGAEGVAEVNYRAHVAFSTAYDQMKNLEQVHNRRKAFIYVSNGYDLNPFSATRKKNNEELAKSMNPNSNCTDDGSGNCNNNNNNSEDSDPFSKGGTKFNFAELANQLSELTRAANRANCTIYTIDPRGLVGGPDIDEKVDMVDYQDYVTTSQNSLRVLAELTGGIAVVNQNDFTKALKRIDAETSDYYVVGYYSTNPDPLKKRRKLEVKVTRTGLNVWSRKEYSLKPTPSLPK